MFAFLCKQIALPINNLQMSEKQCRIVKIIHPSFETLDAPPITISAKNVFIKDFQKKNQ